MNQELSGRYTEISSKAEDKAAVSILNLRIDVDGERPLDVVSGDFGASGTQGCFGSFRFAVNKKLESETLVLTGINGEFSARYHPFGGIRIVVPFGERSPDIRVKLIGAGESSDRLFLRRSRFFKSVNIHNFYEEGVQPLDSFDTQALELSTRRASHQVSLGSAFAEAGLEVTLKEEHNRIPHPGREDGAWVDSDLKNAMAKCYSVAEQPHEDIWLLFAMEYVISTVKGLVVDSDPEKRGCAIFQIATGWETAAEKRMRLFITMHELGHCLNLKHPWAENGSDGYSALSWMNYPWRYRLSEEIYGSEAFWSRFNFQFSDIELLTLRHGFDSKCI